LLGGDCLALNDGALELDDDELLDEPYMLNASLASVFEGLEPYDDG
jgi:hypothetical protein